jgi:cytochrome bd-type quinol oxidase subunit 1
MDYASILADVLHVAIAAPVFAVGIVVGVLGYRFLLKNEPALLNSLVSSAYADLQTALKDLEAKASAAVKPAPAAAATATPATAPVAAVAAVAAPVVAAAPAPTATPAA